MPLHYHTTVAGSVEEPVTSGEKTLDPVTARGLDAMEFIEDRTRGLQRFYPPRP